MTPFRFRAAGALDVRRRQEDEARERLARAEGAAKEAERRAAAAAAAVAGGHDRLGAVQQQGAPAWLIGWHRSWIAGLRTDADTCHRDAATAQGAVAAAQTAVRDAYRRRRTLERWRDRAFARYQRAANAQEVREMNALAGLRFLARAAEEGEHSEHDQRRGPDGRPVDGHLNEQERHERARTGRLHESVGDAAPASGPHAAPGR